MKEAHDKPKQSIKNWRHHFADKGLYNQGYGFSSSYVWMWYLEHKEGWMLKNECFLTVVLVKILENPLDSKEIKPINPKGNQPWIFIGRIDAEAEPQILWPPDVKSWLWEVWRQEEYGVTEDEMVDWHHWISGHEFEQSPWDSEWQWCLAWCNSWSYKESDTTERLNWTECIILYWSPRRREVRKWDRELI